MSETWRRGVPRQCRRCRRFLHLRGTPDVPSESIHRARGLCRRCYDRLAEDERLDYESCSLSADDLLDDWTILRAEGHSKRQAAERLGVTFEAFDRAFHRARAAGDPRAVPALDPSAGRAS